MFDAIVLAGGSARRLGGADKPAQLIAGRSLLDHVLAAVDAADRIVVVGPVRATARPVRWRREDPPGGGPVAALAAAIHSVQAEIVVVLAADLPRIAPAVPALVAALRTSSTDAAILVDETGRRNYLAAAWRRDRLARVIAALADTSGASARSLYARADILEVADPDGWATDCDTWDKLAEARRLIENRERT
ncbi:MAG: NTP transferase domain-containing protein [Jatrophihabitantaceae bacterium]